MKRLAVLVTTITALAASSAASGASPPPPEPAPRTFVLSEALADDGGVVRFVVDPNRHELRLGARVAWTNAGIVPHELEERHELFRWGPIAPGDTEEFRPWAAGRYVFSETMEDELGEAGTWERGTFTVRPFLNPWRRGRAFARWASQAPPEGFVYDVQRLRGLGGTWRWWRRGTTTTTGRFGWFREDSLGSCVAVRARLRSAEDPSRRLGWGETVTYCVVV